MRGTWFHPGACYRRLTQRACHWQPFIRWGRSTASGFATWMEALMTICKRVIKKKSFRCFTEGKNFRLREVRRFRTHMRTHAHTWAGKKKGKEQKDKITRDYTGRAD